MNLLPGLVIMSMLGGTQNYGTVPKREKIEAKTLSPEQRMITYQTMRALIAKDIRTARMDDTFLSVYTNCKKTPTACSLTIIELCKENNLPIDAQVLALLEIVTMGAMRTRLVSVHGENFDAEKTNYCSWITGLFDCRKKKAA